MQIQHELRTPIYAHCFFSIHQNPAHVPVSKANRDYYSNLCIPSDLPFQILFLCEAQPQKQTNCLFSPLIYELATGKLKERNRFRSINQNE